MMAFKPLQVVVERQEMKSAGSGPEKPLQNGPLVGSVPAGGVEKWAFRGVLSPKGSLHAEVQIFLNFGLRGFWRFAILRVLSGEKEEVENYKRENGIICA